MASHDLGELGAGEGEPVLVQWHWFHGKPTLPLWVGLALLLILPKENRKWQAWLILVVPLAAVALRLVYFVPSLGSSEVLEVLIQFAVMFAIGWSAVWLLVPYFGRGSRRRALLLSLAVMLAVGCVGYVGCFGFSLEVETLVSYVCFWVTASLSLLLALFISGARCRETFHWGLIAAWMILWLPLVAAIGTAVGSSAMFLITEGANGPFLLAQIVLMVLFGSPVMSGFLYAVNLPVLILAGTTDCYGERLRAVVYREPLADDPFARSLAQEPGQEPAEESAQEPPADDNPFQA